MLGGVLRAPSSASTPGGITTGKTLSFVSARARSINRGRSAATPRLAAVAALYALTFALQVGTFALLFPPLLTAYGREVANAVGFVVAQGLATTVNFIVQRTVIFRHP